MGAILMPSVYDVSMCADPASLELSTGEFF